MFFEIKNRFSRAVQFTAKINCDEDERTSIKIGLAVKWACKTGADLGGADLGGVVLRGADLGGADLGDAVLRGAYLGGFKVAAGNSFADLGSPNGWTAYAFLTDDGQHRVIVGCRNFTLAEGRAYWAGKDNRREVLAAIEYAEELGRIRGWKLPVEVA